MAEIDLDPNFRYRQAAQNTFFTGMQLGGQIADRRAAMALRQQQMDMNQRELNARLAQMDIQNKDMELAQRARDMQLKEAVEEKTAQVADFRLFNDFMRGLDNWAMNPTGNQMPERPQITSKVFNAAIDGKMNQYREFLPAQTAANERKAIADMKRQIMVGRLSSDRELMGKTGIDFLVEDPSQPDGYRRDEEKRQQALKMSGQQNLMRSVSGPTDVALLSDEDLAQSAGISLDAVPALRKQIGTSRFEIAKLQGARDYVDNLSTVIPMDDREKAYVISKYMGGVNALNAPARVVKDIDSQVQVTELLDDAIANINAFNERYGKNAFAAFTGPIDSMVVEKFAKNFPTGVRQSAISDARNIFNNIKFVVQGYKSGQFGTALSAQEIKSFLGIVSEPDASDYERSVRQFRNSNMKSVEKHVKRYRFSPNIELDVKDKFLGGNMKPVETYEGEFEAEERAELERLRALKAASQPTQ
jgi:hypothetical protein